MRRLMFNIVFLIVLTISLAFTLKKIRKVIVKTGQRKKAEKDQGK